MAAHSSQQKGCNFCKPIERSKLMKIVLEGNPGNVSSSCGGIVFIGCGINCNGCTECNCAPISPVHRSRNAKLFRWLFGAKTGDQMTCEKEWTCPHCKTISVPYAQYRSESSVVLIKDQVNQPASSTDYKETDDLISARKELETRIVQDLKKEKDDETPTQKLLKSTIKKKNKIGPLDFDNHAGEKAKFVPKRIAASLVMTPQESASEQDTNNTASSSEKNPPEIDEIQDLKAVDASSRDAVAGVTSFSTGLTGSPGTTRAEMSREKAKMQAHKTESPFTPIGAPIDYMYHKISSGGL